MLLPTIFSYTQLSALSRQATSTLTYPNYDDCTVKKFSNLSCYFLTIFQYLIFSRNVHILNVTDLLTFIFTLIHDGFYSYSLHFFHIILILNAKKTLTLFCKYTLKIKCKIRSIQKQNAIRIKQKQTTSKIHINNIKYYQFHINSRAVIITD